MLLKDLPGVIDIAFLKSTGLGGISDIAPPHRLFEPSYSSPRSHRRKDIRHNIHILCDVIDKSLSNLLNNPHGDDEYVRVVTNTQASIQIISDFLSNLESIFSGSVLSVAKVAALGLQKSDTAKTIFTKMGFIFQNTFSLMSATKYYDVKSLWSLFNLALVFHPCFRFSMGLDPDPQKRTASLLLRGEGLLEVPLTRGVLPGPPEIKQAYDIINSQLLWSPRTHQRFHPLSKQHLNARNLNLYAFVDAILFSPFFFLFDAIRSGGLAEIATSASMSLILSISEEFEEYLTPPTSDSVIRAIGDRTEGSINFIDMIQTTDFSIVDGCITQIRFSNDPRLIYILPNMPFVPPSPTIFSSSSSFKAPPQTLGGLIAISRKLPAGPPPFTQSASSFSSSSSNVASGLPNDARPYSRNSFSDILAPPIPVSPHSGPSSNLPTSSSVSSAGSQNLPHVMGQYDQSLSTLSLLVSSQKKQNESSAQPKQNEPSAKPKQSPAKMGRRDIYLAKNSIPSGSITPAIVEVIAARLLYSMIHVLEIAGVPKIGPSSPNELIRTVQGIYLQVRRKMVAVFDSIECTKLRVDNVELIIEQTLKGISPLPPPFHPRSLTAQPFLPNPPINTITVRLNAQNITISIFDIVQDFYVRCADHKVFFCGVFLHNSTNSFAIFGTTNSAKLLKSALLSTTLKLDDPDN